MFERYTEKARRVIFFARYEASQFGTPEIGTEHMLLGMMREAPEIFVTALQTPIDAELLREFGNLSVLETQSPPPSIYRSPMPANACWPMQRKKLRASATNHRG